MTNWNEINDKKKDDILKGQCINIAFSDISFSEGIEEAEINNRIHLAKQLYYKLKESEYWRW